MAQSKAFEDASHALNDLSRALALLEAENARLRNDLDAAGTAAYLHDKDQLKAENAKLRELAAQMGEMLDCVICDRRLGCNWRDDGPCWYEIELRELGIEADG
jgi:hypothetical protein